MILGLGRGGFGILWCRDLGSGAWGLGFCDLGFRV